MFLPPPGRSRAGAHSHTGSGASTMVTATTFITPTTALSYHLSSSGGADLDRGQPRKLKVQRHRRSDHRITTSRGASTQHQVRAVTLDRLTSGRLGGPLSKDRPLLGCCGQGPQVGCRLRSRASGGQGPHLRDRRARQGRDAHQECHNDGHTAALTTIAAIATTATATATAEIAVVLSTSRSARDLTAHGTRADMPLRDTSSHRAAHDPLPRSIRETARALRITNSDNLLPTTGSALRG